MSEGAYRDPAAAARDALLPRGRVPTPEDIADAIAFLLSAGARYVHGHDLVGGAVTGNILGRLPWLSRMARG